MKNALLKASLYLICFVNLLGLAIVQLHAACPAGCDSGCKSHNRFCRLTQEGPLYERFASNIARNDACSQAPDGGNPIELDLVSWDTYTHCEFDCEASGIISTGAPQGAKLLSGSGNFNTKCHKGT